MSVQFEPWIAKWIIGDRRAMRHPPPPAIRAVAEELYSKEIEALRSRRCPYCGRRFKTRGALAMHLSRTSSRMIVNPSAPRKVLSVYTNHCYMQFQLMVRHIMETWLKIRTSIIRSRYFNGKHVWVITGDTSPYTKYFNQAEAVKQALKKQGVF